MHIRSKILVTVICLGMIPTVHSVENPDPLIKAGTELVYQKSIRFELSNLEKMSYPESCKQVGAIYNPKVDAFNKWYDNEPKKKDPAVIAECERFSRELAGIMMKEFQAHLSAGRFREAKIVYFDMISIRTYTVCKFSRPFQAATIQAEQKLWAAYVKSYEFLESRLARVNDQFGKRRWSCKKTDGTTAIEVGPTLQQPFQFRPDSTKPAALYAALKLLQESTPDNPASPTSSVSFPTSIAGWKFNVSNSSFTIVVNHEGGGRNLGEEMKQKIEWRVEAALKMAKEAKPTQAPQLSDVEHGLKIDAGKNYLLMMSKEYEWSRQATLIIRSKYGNYFIELYAISFAAPKVDKLDLRKASMHAMAELAQLIIQECSSETESPEPDAGPWLSLQSIDSTDLKPSGTQPSRCRLRAVVVDKAGQPAVGTVITFSKPRLGALSSIQTATDANGQVLVEYMAPTEQELERDGKSVVEEIIAVKDTKTGLQDRVILTTRSQKSQIVAGIKHKILPAHEKYPNTIELIFNLPKRPSDKPYKVSVSLTNEKSAGQLNYEFQLGTRQIAIEVDSPKEHRIVYRWRGGAAPPKDEAVKETVRIEIPELKLREEISFSVGIDLIVKEAKRRRQGPVYPWLYEAMTIVVEDRLHPECDLKSILEEFSLEPSLEIVRSSFVKAPVDDLLPKLLSRFDKIEGVESCYPRPIPFATVQMMQNEMGKSMWVAVDKNFAKKHAQGYPPIYKYPGIDFMDRGKYSFAVSLKTGVWDADESNNAYSKPVLFDVNEYLSEEDELYHTVYLPCIETLIRGAIDLAGGLTALESLSLKANKVLGAVDIGLALKDQKWLNGALSAVGLFNTVISTKLKTDFAKAMANTNTLALYGFTFLDKKGFFGPSSKRDIKAIEIGMDSTLVGIQGFLKGSPKTYLIVIERKGLTRMDAILEDGTRIEAAPLKLLDPNVRKEQRMERGDRFVVIGARNDEKIGLTLAGNGLAGQVLIITAERIHSLPLPNEASWKRSVTASENGLLTK